jgi:hypothetical protein
LDRNCPAQGKRLDYTRLIADGSLRVNRFSEQLVRLRVITGSLGHPCMSLQYASGSEA